jgi:flagellar hook capping protein FlgD
MRLVAVAFAGLLMLAPSTMAFAAWSSDPAVNLPVITGPGDQRIPAAVGDGSGGALVACYESALGRMVVLHILASGDMDPAWPVSGRTAGASTMPYDWTPPTIVSDGAGGAIVGFVNTQLDGRWHPIANRVLESGSIDPTWAGDGQPLCLATFSQQLPSAQPDLAGGAIVVWEDFRGGATGYDIYGARALANGAVDPTSPYPGLLVCAANGDQKGPQTVPDGSGGAIAFWTDYRTGGSGQIYCQHILSSGAVDPAWPANGSLVYVNSRIAPTPVADGSGGAFVACNSGRVFVFHVLSNGAADPAWPADGVAITPSSVVTNSGKSSVSDLAGGMFVVWADNSGLRVRVQHVLGSGIVDPSWPAGGREVPGSLVGNTQATVAVSDGGGGVIITWSDNRVNAWDLYAQHVRADGTLDPAFPPGGRQVSTVPGTQHAPTLVPAASGAIAIWEDYRSGTSWDIYAQLISMSATVAVEPAHRSAITRLNRVTPNPARSSATLSWSLAGVTNMRLVILDVAGRRVREIESGWIDRGDHTRTWDLVDDAGRRVSPGLYFARLDAGSTSTRRFVVER